METSANMSIFTFRCSQTGESQQVVCCQDCSNEMPVDWESVGCCDDDDIDCEMCGR